MTAELFSDWLIRSFVTGAVATLLVRLCPASWKGRFRVLVPVAAFGTLVVLAFGLLRPLPRLEIAAPATIAQASLSWNPGGWVVGLWATGAAMFLARQILGFCAVSRLLRSTHPAPGRIWRHTLAECQRILRLRGKVRLRLAGPGFVPSATGLFRRTVLLPDEALNWTDEQRRLVLLHELGHFQRGDLWTDALGRVACALHWFNPFAWMLQRQLAVEREYACDALVVEKGARPQDYAMVLWQMATASSRRLASSAAFIAMASPKSGKLEQRVQRILNSRKKMGNWLRLADGGLCLLLAVAMMACTACKPVARMIVSAGNGWTPAEVQARLMADPFPASY